MPDASCPECSCPVEMSIRGDLLVYSSPRWLRRVALGLQIATIAIVVSILLSIGRTAISYLIAAMGGTMTVQVVFMVASTATAIAIVIGAWLGTARDPGHPGREPLLSVRRVARVGLTTQLIATPVWSSIWGLAIGGGGGVSAILLAMSIVSLLTIIVLIGQGAALVYLRRLSRRVPAPRIVTGLTIVLWGLIISKSVGQATGVATMVAIQTAPPALSGWFTTVLVISWIAAIVAIAFGFFAVIVLCALLRRLKTVSRIRATFQDDH